MHLKILLNKSPRTIAEDLPKKYRNLSSHQLEYFKDNRMDLVYQ